MLKEESIKEEKGVLEKLTKKYDLEGSVSEKSVYPCKMIKEHDTIERENLDFHARGVQKANEIVRGGLKLVFFVNGPQMFKVLNLF